MLSPVNEVVAVTLPRVERGWVCTFQRTPPDNREDIIWTFHDARGVELGAMCGDGRRWLGVVAPAQGVPYRNLDCLIDMTMSVDAAKSEMEFAIRQHGYDTTVTVAPVRSPLTLEHEDAIVAT